MISETESTKIIKTNMDIQATWGCTDTPMPISSLHYLFLEAWSVPSSQEIKDIQLSRTTMNFAYEYTTENLFESINEVEAGTLLKSDVNGESM